MVKNQKVMAKSVAITKEAPEVLSDKLSEARMKLPAVLWVYRYFMRATSGRQEWNVIDFMVAYIIPSRGRTRPIINYKFIRKYYAAIYYSNICLTAYIAYANHPK